MARSTSRLAIAALAVSLALAPAASVFAGESNGGESNGDATSNAVDMDSAREMFNDMSCSACHTLADADAWGPIGPSFDGSSNLDKAYLVDRITNGSGAMPPFAGQMSDEEIDQMAEYIRQVAEQ